MTSDPQSAGTQLGPYRLEARIGAGAMGEVYRARDIRLDRLVAVKILPLHLRQSPERRARFEREARTISRLMHPHICTLLDIGREGDIEFLVMEYLDGETLAARLLRGPLPLDRALQAGIEIAGALAHLHRHGVVHRDLKPSNVMLTGGGAKLLDFGIAKRRTDSEGVTSPVSSETAEGSLVGTLAYMAPEQFQGQEADARTDIWAFGCVMYETLTGRRAFEGTSHASLIAAILEHQPAPLTKLQPIAPPLLQHVVHTCLAKDADARWQAAADIERELRWIAHPTQPLEPWHAPLARALQRHRRRLLAAALLGLLLVAGALGILWMRPVPDAGSFRISTAVSWPSVEDHSRLSPDGHWLSFISDRDGDPRVFMQNIKSGEVVPIAAPEGGVLSQAWSPDGQELALLLRQGQSLRLQIVPAFFGGAARAVATIEEPALLVRWLGSTIYFEHFYTLLGTDRTSGAVREILRPDPGTWPLARSFDISSDGRVVFTAQTGGNADIWLTDTRGTSPQRLTDDPGSDLHPVLAGDYLFFQSSRGGQPDVWRLTLSERRLSRVTAGVSQLRPEDASADGKLVSVAYASTAAEIWAMSGSTAQTWPVTADSVQDLWPSLSRDGAVVAYQRRKGTLDTAYFAGQAEIVVGRWNGTKIVDSRLAAPSGFAPRMSPDGRRLAYLEWIPGSAFFALKVLDVPTGRSTTVSEQFLISGYFEFPVDLFGNNVVWSSDGSDLYFCERDTSGAARIARVSSETGKIQQVVALSARDRIHGLCLSPDGRRLAYNRYHPERTVVVVHDMVTDVEHEWFTDQHGPQGRLQALGWDGERLLVVRSRNTAGLPKSMDFLALSGPQQFTVLRQQSDGYPATARVDLTGRRILITLHEHGADNLFAVPLDSGTVVRLTANDQPSVSFSNVEFGPDRTFLFARHDRKQDIWLVREADRP